ncbi:putative mitochondrial carrier C12B10.09 [Daldinia childiae]|uniref:putative mitochondrial carrier C12B10.09 n=1 Tax=Daldinia childiae TaxID=326645 RepID=UPI0014476F28|nr:putative mitochondrial carrier C12B10.09 [Daldinia childiae]KAF3067044.1 putative mitochondrial carrier C12B10.09 [Daldinia childiae]
MGGNSNLDVMLAGGGAAFVVDLIVYPLDTLKTRQQSRDFVKTFANPSTKTKLPSRQLFRGLYQGIGIVIVTTLPAAGTFFTTYEAAKSFINRHGSPLGLPQPLVHAGASAIGECASCLVLTPSEVIKQNAQMLQQKSGSSRRSASLQALKQLTVSGTGVGRKLLSGYTVLIARNLPFTAIQFPIFEYLRTKIWSQRSRTGQSNTGFGAGEKRTLLETGVITGTSAGLAGSLAAIVTTPMDVVKTRMMLAAGSSQGVDQGVHDRTHTSQGVTKYKVRGGLAVAREVVSETGISGLFRGSALRAVWTLVGSGLYLGTYEVAKVWLSRRKGQSSEDDAFI